MNLRTYVRVNYHGVCIRWLSMTLANAFDWMKYQHRGLESSAGLNSWRAYAHVKMYSRSINNAAYAHVNAHWRRQQVWFHLNWFELLGVYVRARIRRERTVRRMRAHTGAYARWRRQQVWIQLKRDILYCNSHMWPLLLTWFNFNPSMDM